jgi:hypothetical protein
MKKLLVAGLPFATLAQSWKNPLPIDKNSTSGYVAY